MITNKLENTPSLLLFCSLLLLLMTCNRNTFKDKWTQQQAPDYFQARFETTKGHFDIEARREWAPTGVDRLYQLIKSGFYQDIALFRVVPDYVVQFGIHNDSTLNRAWRKFPLQDEAVIEKNTLGTIAFARGGPNTRTTQIYININNNSPRLDTLSYVGVSGFPVIARVTEGMDVVLSFYDEYGNEPAGKQDSIQTYGNAFLKRNYPQLDYVKKAYILE
jgi:peptidyl-prolyl cis-trans isomerase A (cyclophilin A)